MVITVLKISYDKLKERNGDEISSAWNTSGHTCLDVCATGCSAKHALLCLSVSVDPASDDGRVGLIWSVMLHVSFSGNSSRVDDDDALSYAQGQSQQHDKIQVCIERCPCQTRSNQKLVISKILASNALSRW